MDSSPFRSNSLRWTDHLVALLLGAAALVALMMTMDLGFTRDEGYYFKAGQLYLGWFKDALRLFEQGDFSTSFTQANIDKHWGYNPEHPALIKALFGLSYWIFHETLQWMSPGTSMRFPGALFSAALVSMVYTFTTQAFGRLEAFFAACATLLIPRPFFHYHLACFDAPMTTIWFACMVFWWRGLRSNGWGWMTGLMFGVALSTKLNSFFIPFVFLAHWACVAWHRVSLISPDSKRSFHFLPKSSPIPPPEPTPSQNLSHAWNLHLPPIPVAFLSMATLAPFVWYILWPRHWFDTFNRIAWYMKFHLQHVHYFQYYFGQNLYEPPFPVEFPFSMSLFTMPEVTLIAFLLGTVWLVLEWLRMQSPSLIPILEHTRSTLRTRFGTLPDDTRATGLLLLLGGGIPFLVIAMPSSPIFGGIKHWMPAMPFMAIVAGVGAGRAARAIVSHLPFTKDTDNTEGTQVHSAPLSTLQTTAAALLLALWLVPAATATLHNHGYGTAYYNTLLGGTRGAADAQMMRQFWGYSSIHSLPFLNENVRPNGTVFFQNTNWDSYNMYQRHNMLRKDIRYGSYPTFRTAQYSLIHHQMAARSLELEIWRTYKTQNPAFVGAYDGVPVISVYENQRMRRTKPAKPRTQPKRTKRPTPNAKPPKVAPKKPNTTQ